MTNKRLKLIQDLSEAMSALKASFYHDRSREFMKQGIGMPHFMLMLKMAASDDGISVGELSDAMHITPGAVTQFVDKLVEKGLVERFEDPKDRRIVRIKVTNRAKNRFDKMKHTHLEKMADKLKNLSDEELQQLTNLISKIKVNPEDAKHSPWYHVRSHHKN